MASIRRGRKGVNCFKAVSEIAGKHFPAVGILLSALLHRCFRAANFIWSNRLSDRYANRAESDEVVRSPCFGSGNIATWKQPRPFTHVIRHAAVFPMTEGLFGGSDLKESTPRSPNEPLRELLLLQQLRVLRHFRRTDLPGAPLMLVCQCSAMSHYK